MDRTSGLNQFLLAVRMLRIRKVSISHYFQLRFQSSSIVNYLIIVIDEKWPITSKSDCSTIVWFTIGTMVMNRRKEYRWNKIWNGDCLLHLEKRRLNSGEIKYRHSWCALDGRTNERRLSAATQKQQQRQQQYLYTYKNLMGIKGEKYPVVNKPRAKNNINNGIENMKSYFSRNSFECLTFLHFITRFY